MKRQAKVILYLKSLSVLTLAKFNAYYPWLVITAITFLFLLSSPLLITNNSRAKITVKTIIRERKISSTKYPKILVFIGDKNNRGKGKLIAVNTKEAGIDGAFGALSGVGGNETQIMRGPIPSNEAINRIHYWVDTKPLILSNPGIAGNFYKINPHFINVDGVTRGDFGIHADRNFPGTAGCIGIESEKEWQIFKDLMKDYQHAGLTRIPLIVSYR
ncbi:MAG: hypothetical protein AB4062_19745 [Crocosphaera sp.]